MRNLKIARAPSTKGRPTCAHADEFAKLAETGDKWRDGCIEFSLLFLLAENSGEALKRY